MKIFNYSINNTRYAYLSILFYSNLFLLLLVSSHIAYAEDQGVISNDPFSLSLEEALNIPVQIASKGSKQSIRRAPGSITVLDSQYIYNSGARDLKELLEMVPGFQFGTDTSGTSVIAFRGLANSGRILLRVDGQEMPELAFNTLQFGNHYSTSNIEKVEIIRGPGSVLYGGSAQYAVIEVTTKKPSNDESKSENGLVSFNTGVTSDGLSRLNENIWQGYSSGEDYISAALSHGKSTRGSGLFEDFYGGSFAMDEDSDQYMRFLNVGGKYGDVSFRYIGDRYHNENRDLFFVVAPYALRQEFEQDRAELRYSPTLSDQVSAEFYINYTFDQPWKTNDESSKALEESDPEIFGGSYYNKRVTRLRGTSEFTYKPTDNYTFLLGSTVFDDEGRGFEITGEESPRYDASNTAVYGEASFNPEVLTATIGTRYEDNSEYGSAWVSRAALTKSEASWHAKLQVAQSFRAPGYENTIGFYDPTGESTSIEPEDTIISEAEFGIGIGQDIYLTTTIFDVQTSDTISYFFDPEIGDAYGNLGDTGSRGIETTVRYVHDRGDISLWYAYHKAENDNPSFAVISGDGTIIDEDRFFGFSPHIATLMSNIRITQKINFHTALQYQNSKYTVTSVTEDDVLIPEKLSDEYLLKANVTFKDTFIDKLDIQLGINNILNEQVNYGFPALAYHAPVPGLDREYYMNARFRW